MTYDSKADTLEHISIVNSQLALFTKALISRGVNHDKSKLRDPEKAMFDEYTPKLKGLKYPSEEYSANLKAMGPALQHHYENNSHHPEHFGEAGIKGMSLVDVVEMLCDWYAATLRHDPPGDLKKSIEWNQERYGYSDDLKAILHNTADWLLQMNQAQLMASMAALTRAATK